MPEIDDGEKWVDLRVQGLRHTLFAVRSGSFRRSDGAGVAGRRGTRSGSPRSELYLCCDVRMASNSICSSLLIRALCLVQSWSLTYTIPISIPRKQLPGHRRLQSTLRPLPISETPHLRLPPQTSHFLLSNRATTAGRHPTLWV